MAKRDVAVLIFASILLIVGSALMWNAIRRNTFARDDQKRIWSYETVVFLFAMLTAWMHYFASQKDPYARVIWRYLFFGLLFFAAVTSVQNWQSTDTNRHFINDDGGNYDTQLSTKYAFSGQIIGYVGLGLALLTIQGAFYITSYMSVVLWLIAVICAVIGSVILWCLDTTEIDDQTGNRFFAWYICSSMWITVLLLAGAVFNEHIDGANAAVLAVGYFGLWYLSYGLTIKRRNENDDDQEDKSWAGMLFSWFAAWSVILAARWAVASKNTAVVVNRGRPVTTTTTTSR